MKKNEKREFYRYAYFFVDVVFGFGLSLIALAYLGFWLDRKLQTNKVLFYILLLLGIVGGIANAYKAIKKLFPPDEEDLK